MSVFDEDINLKNLETIALFKQIRAIIDWIHKNLDSYYNPVLIETDVMSILKRYGYDCSVIPDNMLNFWEKWGELLGVKSSISYDCNYKYELLYIDEINIDDPLKNELKKIAFTFSKIELIILNGEVYINCVGNNIIHMRYFIPIPDFIKFIGDPYIVITTKIDSNKIRGYRHDCRLMVYDKDYPLNNIIEEEYDISIENLVCDIGTSPNITNTDTWVQKIDYSNKMDYGVVQDIYSKTIGGSISSIQV